MHMMSNAFYFCTTLGHKYAHDVTAFKGHILKCEGTRCGATERWETPAAFPTCSTGTLSAVFFVGGNERSEVHFLRGFCVAIRKSHG